MLFNDGSENITAVLPQPFSLRIATPVISQGQQNDWKTRAEMNMQ